VEAIANSEAPELVWLREHPPAYTSGTSGKTPTCSLPVSRCFDRRGGQ